MAVLEKMRNDIKCDVLVVCVTKIEIKQLFQVLNDKGYKTGPAKTPNTKLSYHWLGRNGKINGAKVLCIQTSMGSTGQGSSSSDVKQAIIEVSPKYIISVGIAFGLKEGQEIGDVLVANKIALYDKAKLVSTDRGSERIERGAQADVPTEILNKIRSAMAYYEFANITEGLILTGDKLIDDLEFAKLLKNIFPEAIGGEMEAGGIYTANTYESCQWIVIKSICDFADGNKNKNKLFNQEKAASNAARFVIFSLEKIDFKTHSVKRHEEELNITLKYDSDPNLSKVNKEILGVVIRKLLESDVDEITIKRTRNPKYLTKEKQQLFILMGGAGAGKTSFYNFFLKPMGAQFISDEAISKALSPDSSIDPKDETARIVKDLMSEYLNRGTPICYEAKFSYKSELQSIILANRSNYKVNIIYIHLANSMLNMARVSQQNVKAAKVLNASILNQEISDVHNTLSVVAELVDSVVLYDNSDFSPPFKRIAVIKNGHVSAPLGELPLWTKNIIGG
ncbi:hypothetical protein NBRC116493_35420 [Aurantivibrio infirmus]